MFRFAGNDYEIDKAIAQYEGFPFIATKTSYESDPWEEAKDAVIQRHQEYALMGDPSSAAVENAKYHLDQVYDEANQIAQNLGGPTTENFVAAIEQIYSLGGNNGQRSSSCNCWDGYKRVPGTKPCAPGSCEKCDSHSKESVTKNSGAISDVVREIVAIYSSQPQFAQVISRTLMQMMQAAGQATKAGINGSLVSQINDYIKYIYGLWTSGQVELDDIDQMLLSANLFGETNNALPGGYTAKFAAQGDKPSPNAAKNVLYALEAGDNNSAKSLLGNTDCPEECEVHAEGKCNHGFMSAGRTRVRYLVDDTDFEKEAKSKKEALFGMGLVKRLVKMVIAGQCPVCKGEGKLMKVKTCMGCDGTGDANVFKQKVGQIGEKQLPQIVDEFRSQVGAPSVEDDFDWLDDTDLGGYEDDINRRADEMDPFDDFDEVDRLLAPSSPAPTPAAKPGLWDRTKQIVQDAVTPGQPAAPAAPVAPNVNGCPTCGGPLESDGTCMDCSWNENDF